jgi:hypothetical protein
MPKGPKPKSSRPVGDPKATKAAQKTLRDALKLIKVCDEEIAKGGHFYVAPTGFMCKNPAVDTKLRACALLISAARLLGVEPPMPKEADDAYEKFLKGRKK